MRKVLGYGYQIRNESLNHTLMHYNVEPSSLHKSINEMKKTIKYDKEEGIIGAKTKPRLFRVIVEEVENDERGSR